MAKLDNCFLISLSDEVSVEQRDHFPCPTYVWYVWYNFLWSVEGIHVWLKLIYYTRCQLNLFIQFKYLIKSNQINFQQIINQLNFHSFILHFVRYVYYIFVLFGCYHISSNQIPSSGFLSILKQMLLNSSNGKKCNSINQCTIESTTLFDTSNLAYQFNM